MPEAFSDQESFGGPKEKVYLFRPALACGSCQAHILFMFMLMNAFCPPFCFWTVGICVTLQLVSWTPFFVCWRKMYASLRWVRSTPPGTSEKKKVSQGKNIKEEEYWMKSGAWRGVFSLHNTSKMYEELFQIGLSVLPLNFLTATCCFLCFLGKIPLISNSGDFPPNQALSGWICMFKYT